MHCHQELLDDLKTYEGFLPDALLMKWFNDKYSTSKHLLTLYSIVRGLNAKRVIEVGFGTAELFSKVDKNFDMVLGVELSQ